MIRIRGGRIEMTKKDQWTLQEIREAYIEILKSYNALFPLEPLMRREVEQIEMPETFHRGDDNFQKGLMTEMKKVIPKLREAADQSGGAVTWRYGESLDGLNQGLKNRVERALKFGI